MDINALLEGACRREAIVTQEVVEAFIAMYKPNSIKLDLLYHNRIYDMMDELDIYPPTLFTTKRFRKWIKSDAHPKLDVYLDRRNDFIRQIKEQIKVENPSNVLAGIVSGIAKAVKNVATNAVGIICWMQFRDCIEATGLQMYDFDYELNFMNTSFVLGVDIANNEIDLVRHFIEIVETFAKENEFCNISVCIWSSYAMEYAEKLHEIALKYQLCGSFIKGYAKKHDLYSNLIFEIVLNIKRKCLD